MIKTILQTVLVFGLFTSNLSAEEKLIPGGDSARESTCSSTEYFHGNGSYFDDTNIHMASGLAATTVVNVDTPTLMITGLFSHNRNSERGIELYVLEDIPDLSIYAIGVVNTAAGSEGPEFYLSGAATAGQFLYLALYPETFQDFLGFAPDFDLGGSSNLGAFGTQAVELFVDDSGIPTLIDVYGIATESGSAQSWDYRSAWAYRKNNTGPDTTFNLNNWRIPGPYIFEGYSNNLEAPIPFPHGTYGQAYDESPPTAVCQDVTFESNQGNFRLDPNLIGSSSSDNVGVALLLLDDDSFGCADGGLNEVVLTAYDAAGNKTTCSATVTVKPVESQVFCRDKMVNLSFNGQVSVDLNDLLLGVDGICLGEAAQYFLSPSNPLDAGSGEIAGATSVDSPVDTIIGESTPFYYEVFTFTVPSDGLYVPQFSLSTNDEEILFAIISEDRIVPNSGEIPGRAGFVDAFAFEAPGILQGSFSGEDEVFLTAGTTYYLQVATEVPLAFSGIFSEGWSSPETFQSYTFTGDDLGENFLFLVGLDEAGVTTSCKSTITVKELNPFVTTWKTDNSGTSDSLQVTLPIYQASSRDYRFDIDWGDGNFSYDRNASTTHTYDSAGVYTVRISGDFPRIYFNNEGDKEKLLTVEQWGDIQWSSMESAFHGCRHLNITNPTIDSPDLSNVISLANMFDKCYAFNGHISHWDVSSVQIFDEMFSFCTVFDQAIGAWDMRSARSLYFMLEEAHQFNQDLNAWDVSNVTIMDGLFYYALVFDQDLNNWDVSQVNSMVEMFYVANLFNGDITSWNVSHVENMEGMFEEAYAFNQDISNWEVGNVKDMSGMFGSTQRFNQDIGSWDVSQVTDMLGMFNGARGFNQDIGDWNVGKVTNMRNMFRSADAFNQDIGDWEVGNVTRMDAMFQESDLFNQDLASWDVSQVKDMRRMFENAASFDQDLGKWDIGGLADNVFSSGLEEMFKGAGLSVSNYDATLIGWHTDASGETGDGKDDIPYDIVFGAGNSQYCAGDSARQVLINTYRWSIMDAGQDCLTVNADDLTFGAEIKMYPNPSSNLIYFTGDLKDLRMVEIYGLNGQRLMVFKNNWNQVDISPLPPSIYFVKLVSEQSFKTFKLLKE